jgi:hypothetical protein
VLFIEGAILWNLPSDVLSVGAWRRTAVDLAASYAPVIHNFDRVVPYPEVYQAYFALTFLFLLPKTALLYAWLNSDRRANYRFLVVSPLTTTTPPSWTGFVIAPLDANSPASESAAARRSMLSRVIWSVAIVALFLGFVAVTLTFGWQVRLERASGMGRLFDWVARGRFGLWFSWSVLWMTFLSLWAAVVVAVLRDYAIFLSRLTFNERRVR